MRPLGRRIEVTETEAGWTWRLVLGIKDKVAGETYEFATETYPDDEAAIMAAHEAYKATPIYVERSTGDWRRPRTPR